MATRMATTVITIDPFMTKGRNAHALRPFFFVPTDWLTYLAAQALPWSACAPAALAAASVMYSPFFVLP